MDYENSVILIGNGPSALRHGELGEAIDRFGNVCRFNRYELTNAFTPFVGKKTDTWITCWPARRPESYSEYKSILFTSWMQESMMQFDGCDCANCVNCRARCDHERVRRTAQEAGVGHRFELMPLDTITECKRQMCYHAPTCGALAVMHFLKTYPVVYIHGFDFLSDPKVHHYNHDTDLSEMDRETFMYHSPEHERNFFRDMLATGRVRFLSTDAAQFPQIEEPTVSCVTATYGRHRLMSRVLTQFLLQDYPKAELVVLNNHPEPLIFDHPRVRIYNEAGYPTLGDCRNRLLQLAEGELIRTWDDDDLYLPWTVRQGAENIGAAVAFQPHNSYCCKGPSAHTDAPQFSLDENTFEAALTARTEFVRSVGYQADSGGDEHQPVSSALGQLHHSIKVHQERRYKEQMHGFRRIRMSWMSSYAYCWGWGEWHISGSLGSDNIENRTRTWCEKNKDVRPGVPLEIVDMTDWWEKWRDRAIPEQFRDVWQRRLDCALEKSDGLVARKHTPTAAAAETPTKKVV